MIPTTFFNSLVLFVLLIAIQPASAQSTYSGTSLYLHQLETTLLSRCDSLDTHNRRVQYKLSRVPFITKDEALQYADSLKSIRAHLDLELSQCTTFPDVSSTLSTMINLFDIIPNSREIKTPRRSIFFSFEDVPAIYHDDIEAQIRTQVDLVEQVFSRDLNLTTGNKSLAFFITNRRILDPDVGGANIGSFIWLPLEYSLGYGQQWPDGVRESTVRHEIVHAFMNHVSQSPIEHAYPKVFVEGIALYLSDNRIIELHRRTSVRLSDEYIGFLRTFEFMEEQAGRPEVLAFIRDMLMGNELNFAEGFERLTDTSYASYLSAQPSLLEHARTYAQNTLRIPRSWQRYISVFGALGGIAFLFLTVRLPANKREEVRRNISVAVLTFVIISFLTQGRLVEMASRNYLPFILVSLFMAILLRGYPYVKHEDLMKDLREQSVHYQEDED